MPARKATEGILPGVVEGFPPLAPAASPCRLPPPSPARAPFPLCDERRTKIVPVMRLTLQPRGASASQRTVTSPCRHRAGPSVTGQSTPRSRTARIQRWRAP